MSNKLFILLSAALLLLAACKPCDDPTNPECENYCNDWRNPDCFNFCIDSLNPACPNYNPCFAEKQVSADFWIIESGELVTLFDTLYRDTVLSSDLVFQAINVRPDWNYTWYIGARTYDGPRVSLSFSSAPSYERIPIVLVVSGPENSTCFPESDGRDTLIRWFVRISPPDPTRGKWSGYRNGNLQDTVWLEFFRDPEPFGDLRVRGTVADFSEGFPGFDAGGLTFRKHLFRTSCCNQIRGLILRDPAKVGDFDSVRITYSFPGTDTFRIDGRRVR
jgi:hypothetical protein